MEKKGFTLIELLAVIVILAIIALIAIPMILNVIENAKKGSAEASANAYKEALTQLIAENEIKGINRLQTNNTYYVTRETTIGGTYYEAINDIIKIKGYKPIGYDDYIKFGKHYEIEEAVLTINGYEIKLEDNKVVAVEKGEIIELEYITVTETETMERGSSYTIETIFEPINTSDQRIKYTSSNNSIVTVDENGLVKAIKNGEAKITVTSLSNKSLKKEITITVISPSEVKGIKLNKESTIIGLGKNEDIIATLEPSDATSNALTWESNNDVVSVSDSGKITGTKLGTAIVTATTQSGLKASIEVTVEYQITLNDKKYYTANDNITIDNVDTTNKTNISCNNGSIPSINGNNVTITNITSSVECVINDSLKETVDNIDSSLNNILMINDETNDDYIHILDNKNVDIDLNGKIISANTSYAKIEIIGSNSILNIKDSVGNGKIVNTKQDAVAIGGPNNTINSSVNIESIRRAYTVYRKGINSTINVTGGNITCNGISESCIYVSKAYESINILDAKIDTTLMIGVSGTLNIKNTIINSNKGIILQNDSDGNTGNIKIENSTIISNGDVVSILNKSNSTIEIINSTIKNIGQNETITNSAEGTIILENSYITNSGSFRVIDNVSTGSIIINGDNAILDATGKYVSGMYVLSDNHHPIYNSSTGSITINGGTIENLNSNIWNGNGELHINGGIIRCGVSLGTSGKPGIIYIKNATLENNALAPNIGTNANSKGNIYICSGNFINGRIDIDSYSENVYIYYKNGVNWLNGANTPSILGTYPDHVINDDSIVCE